MDNLDISIFKKEKIDFNPHNKIFIKNGRFSVGNPDNESISDLRLVVNRLRESIKGQNLGNLNLRYNLEGVNSKIKKRNEKIDRNFILNKIDLVLKTLSFGLFSLKIKELTIPVQLGCQSKSDRRTEPPASLDIEVNAENTGSISSQEVLKAKSFEEKVDYLFDQGVLVAVNKPFDSHLAFFPDDPTQISREKRLVLMAKAVLIAPIQPEDRPFEYVGFGAGTMRQDLHQVMALIEQGINPINISLIDVVYNDQNEDLVINQVKEQYGSNWDPKLCLSEFREVLKLKAPNVKVEIGLYPSADAWLGSHQITPIDLLTAIRVPNGDAMDSVHALQEKMADNSGALICSDKNNKEEIKCLRNCLELNSGEIQDLMKIPKKNQYLASLTEVSPELIPRMRNLWSEAARQM